MSSESSIVGAPLWRNELPLLSGRVVTLREPVTQDLGPLVDLLSIGDATRFGLDEPVTDVGVQELIERVARERAGGLAFTYVITLATARTVVGLVQVRQLDPSFEAAEWECTIAPSSRGTGIFLEAARLVGSFAFGIDRRAPARSARAAAERPRQRRAAQARRRAGRRAAAVGPPRRRIFRSGAVVAAQGRLGRSLGVHRAAGPLMRELPAAARLYVGAVIVAGRR